MTNHQIRETMRHGVLTIGSKVACFSGNNDGHNAYAFDDILICPMLNCLFQFRLSACATCAFQLCKQLEAKGAWVGREACQPYQISIDKS